MRKWYIFIFINGCNWGTVTEDNFFDQYAQAQCVVYKRCYRARFDGEYDGMGRCLDEVFEDIAEEKETLFAECSFKEDQAQICLDLLNKSSCIPDDRLSKLSTTSTVKDNQSPIGPIHS